MGFASRNYDGTLKTAIIKEMELPSEMYKEYKQVIYDSIYKRTKNKALATKLSDKAIEEYGKMKIADGQGWITFEAYRILKEAEGNWSDQQEALYRRVAMGENVTAEDVVEFFPSYKLQYFGNIESTGLPVNSFHKFSLAPLIPGVAKQGTPLYDLHQKMMEDKIDYVLMESGSKVSHIGTGDVVLNEDGTFNKDSKFTENTIFAEFLKNQTEVNQSYKEKSIFSTQLRKLILEGLYERGVIKSTEYSEITNTRVKRYIDHVEEYTELLKLELLEEMGYEEVKPGQYKAKDKSSTGKLLNMIRTNLEREDVLSDDLIEFIDVFDESGELVNDLSFHPEAAKIEKLLLSMINKRVIKQKVSGEPLVQVSAGMYANQFTKPDLRKATKDEIKKWASASYLLPNYHKKSDGFTAAAKVMIAMQGTYYNLFNLEYENGETVGVYNESGDLNMDQSLARLNEKIKDDAWLDANDGANRKAITLVGVRIPVQGLNSMEFAEVFEFLPPQAGNIIIPPAEIVAKSGGDFDIDKLTIFMNTLDENGAVVKRGYKDLQAIKDLRGTDEFEDAVKLQKAALENELIDDIRNILELPDNYVSLVMPNGTFILKDIADNLAQYVSKYNPKATKMTKGTNTISPTRVLEALYNVYKHESNIVGKKTLGLGAVENTFHVILNSLGAYMPDTYFIGKEGLPRKSNMRLRHNEMEKKGKKVISMSDIYDVDGVNKISDVISQMMNGWVDVEKDAWIFFIQGNYEVAPTLLYMVKAGVPVKEAIYFVSNPLVLEYVQEQRLAKSTYAEVLGKKPESPGLAKYVAASEIIAKYFSKTELEKNSKNEKRYAKGQQLLEKYFEGKSKKYFTESEMFDLIEDEDFKKNKLDQAKAMFLHYLELEQQIGGYTALKMSSNPDTSTKATLSDVEQTEANLEQLFYDSRIPLEIVEAMQNNSILKSFFNGPLALAVSKPLFKIRLHQVISDYLIGKRNQIRNNLDGVFPGQNVEMFSNIFRNDLISFILQNAIRKYRTQDGVASLDIETKIPTKLAKELKRGAFVKEGVLYMDMKQLEKEFKENAWTKNNEVENSYEDRGLYPLDPTLFMTDSQTGFNEYLKFVSQREYLRSITPMSKEFVDTKYFQEELRDTKESMPDLTNEKAVRYTYEKLLAIKALDNAYNLKHLFQDEEDSFAVRLSVLLQNYPDLVKQYPVLGKLKMDTDLDNKIYNMFIAEKDYDNDKSNLYSEDLKKLANPSIPKVEDPAENQRISDMFKFLNMYAFLQTGLNKTKLNFTNLVDFTDFLNILKIESDAFVQALETNGDAILDQFYDRFLKENDVKSNTKNRFKNYLFDIDLKTVEKPTTQPTVQANVKTYTGLIKELSPNQVFVFGSNLEGLHGKGAAGVAFGKQQSVAEISKVKDGVKGKWAVKGVGEGLQEGTEGKSYAFPSVVYPGKKRSRTDAEIIESVKRFYDTARNNPNLEFLVAYSTKPGLAGYTPQELANFFSSQPIPSNVVFEEGFSKLLTTKELLGESIQSNVDSTNMDTKVEEKRLGLKLTEEPFVYTYNDKKATNVYYYTNITKNNSDVVFLHNNSVYEIRPQQKEKGTTLGGSSYFMSEAPNMSVDFPTNLFSHVENGQKVDLPVEQYDNLKAIWEKRISLVKQIQEKNGKIAFPEYGFGNVNTMPQELFVYLSKRLFEEFQFVNPGSTKFNQIMEMVGQSQGITDDEILLQLELEEDPFKCS